ncbi:MAG: glycerophosphodiester phosphodiesterase [Acidobacteria bacterium]|nr:glycerophosphodiester phosphodiesterase [Acidobacteriota bacterium]
MALGVPLAACALVCALAASTVEADDEEPVDAATQPSKTVIAHRGASGYLPEHTLPAYALAHGMGADYIEPDLVLTRDGHFICLHDIYLQATTNVEEVFPDRARDDGRWYAADFTLDEVRQLQAEERLGNRFPKGRSRFVVPAFTEMIELVQGLNEQTGRTVGIYPELKAPEWHRAQGLPMEESLLEVVGRYGYVEQGAPIFVQSFEAESLKRLRALGSELRQVFLMAEVAQYRSFLSAEGIAGVAGFATGIGPAKTMLEQQPELIGWAHDAGLTVHPYTFRADQVPDRDDSHEAELRRYLFDLGVDGVFTDFPDRARAVVDQP